MPTPLQASELHPDDAAMLRSHPFDAAAFEENRRALAAGHDPGRLSELGAIEPADLDPMPEAGSEQHRLAREAGAVALHEGKIALAVLVGGMATRFGGGVKALVEVAPGQRLLDLRRTAPAPLVLMTSFATHRAVGEHVGSHPGVWSFVQGLAPRVRPDAELWTDGAGRLSMAATGHGDFAIHLRSSGVLRSLRDAGVRTVLMTNVDNVAATPDPLIAGLHLLGGQAITVEVVPRGPADRGGSPLRHRGRPRIVEDPAIPETFDRSVVEWLNTNTLWMELDALDRSFPLSWVAARKTHHGQDVVQFERLVGELTAFLPTRFVAVDRGGERGRFVAIKTPEDLPEAARWLTRHGS
jgi:UTP--glucose-1-phosphate uridylyltransferase